jgi:hypothetical protein
MAHRFHAAIFSLLLLPLAGAGLDFGETTRELHAAPDQNIITTDIDFKNTSSKTVTIERYEATCSCMGVKVKGGKLQYAPGESGVLRTTFDMRNFVGDTQKAIDIVMAGDGLEKDTVTLDFNIHIPVLVVIEPRTLSWDIGEAAKPKKFEITMNHSEPIRVKSVQCGKDTFTFQLTTLEEGKRYEITATPKSTASPELAVISVITDCKIERQATQRIFTVVRPKTPRSEAPPQE